MNDRLTSVCVCQYAGIDAVAGLPLAAGLLVATARLDEDLRELVFSIEVDRLDVEQAVRSIGQADVVGLSVYPWNSAYTFEVARAAKAANPDGLIVAGGPAVPRRQASARALLEAHPCIDVLVFGEGELAFCELLRTLRSSGELDEVPSIAYREPDGSSRFTSEPERVLDFNKTGSPYLDGTFDSLIERYPQRFAMALIETNRGCPFSCTFCDWSLTRKVVELPFERVAAEIDWATRQQMSAVCFTDANFGIRRRDQHIATHLAERKAETGSPHTCFFYLTKNSHKRNLKTIEILTDAGISYCVGLAVQDFDDDVLVAVKRDNIQSSHSEQLGTICAERGIRTHNELILGLPGQTYDSFVETVLRAMTPYALHEFHIFQCRLIDNTELAGAESRQRHGIESRRCLWRPTEAGFDSIVHEYQELVVATNTMSVDDWRRTCRLTYFAAAVYNQRLLRVMLRYLHEQGIDRRAWLEHLCDAMNPGSKYGVFRAMGQVVDRLVDSILDNGPLSLPLEGLGQALHEMGAAVTVTALTNAVDFFKQTRKLSIEHLGDSVPAALIDEMLGFQELCTPLFKQAETRQQAFSHDWLSYAADSLGKPLVARNTVIQFQPPTYVQMRTAGEFVDTHLACMLAGLPTGETRELNGQSGVLALKAVAG